MVDGYGSVGSGGAQVVGGYEEIVGPRGVGMGFRGGMAQGYGG